MAKKRSKNLDEPAVAPAPSRSSKLPIFAFVLLAAAAAWFVTRSFDGAANTTNPTFVADIAPLVYKDCASCHHEGGTGPFPLLTFADVSKRAGDIARVTGKRVMPPWLPEHGYGDFEGERHLTDDEILMLKVWANLGAPEGEKAKTPPPPKYDSGWQLGKPDLVVQMPNAYTLPAEGRDVYRNFVVPIPVSEEKFVKGIEFRAGSSRIHHVFMYVDPTFAARKRDGKDGQPGWPGMNELPESAVTPNSLFMSWQPGKTPRLQEDMAWKLTPGTDLILQMHMQSSGKPEPVQPSVAFYFTDRPGPVKAAIVLLRSVDLEIPAGEKNFLASSEYVAPIDVDIRAVLPHVHYLGKDLKGFATLPDGSKKWLLWIKNWNFNWQGDYAFKEPVFLPKGTKVTMEFTFDNSAENTHNPSQPPKAVHFGTQSTDEMCELWLQLVPRNPADMPTFHQDIQRRGMADLFAMNSVILKHDPGNAHAHYMIGKALLKQGQLPQAQTYLSRAVQLDELNANHHYYFGYLLGTKGDINGCIREYRRAIQLDRDHVEALNALGAVLLNIGNPRDAELLFLEAKRLRPNDELIAQNLAIARKALGK